MRKPKLTSEQFSRMSDPCLRGRLPEYWQGVCKAAPELGYKEKKQAFLYLLERKLKEGKARFVMPGADYYPTPPNPYPRYKIGDDAIAWRAQPIDIVRYINAVWPKRVKDENDCAVLSLLQLIPALIWRESDGTWEGSKEVPLVFLR